MQNGAWSFFTSRNFSELKLFLRLWEYRNVNLSRYFLPDGIPRVKFGKSKSLLLYKPEGVLKGLLLKGPYGLFLPLFPDSTTFRQSGIPIELKNFRTLMGTVEVIESVEPFLKENIRDSVSYRLMCLPKNTSLPYTDSGMPEGITIRRASVSDADILFPLQKAYEIEEVVLKPENFNSFLCMENLRKNLKEEIVYMAEINGKPLAKGGTNARGVYVSQLGGIFTRPEYRSRGISRAIITKIVKKLREKGQTACLFVKPENKPAINVYRNSGFSDISGFKISYLK